MTCNILVSRHLKYHFDHEGERLLFIRLDFTVPSPFQRQPRLLRTPISANFTEALSLSTTTTCPPTTKSVSTPMVPLEFKRRPKLKRMPPVKMREACACQKAWSGEKDTVTMTTLGGYGGGAYFLVLCLSGGTVLHSTKDIPSFDKRHFLHSTKDESNLNRSGRGRNIPSCKLMRGRRSARGAMFCYTYAICHSGNCKVN